jgi:hypothetical protein
MASSPEPVDSHRFGPAGHPGLCPFPGCGYTPRSSALNPDLNLWDHVIGSRHRDSFRNDSAAATPPVPVEFIRYIRRSGRWYHCGLVVRRGSSTCPSCHHDCRCYKQYTRVIKIDTETVLQTVHRHFQNRAEMTCCRPYTGVLKIDTEMKCFKQYRGVLKIDTEIASVLCIRVHSSRDRHCCIYRYKYISGRDQVEVSKARSKSTTANNLCFRYSGGRSISNASPEKQY